MGMFSFIEKGLGLRTGATRAAKNAKAAGQATLQQQEDLQEELGGIYQPTMDVGQKAFTGLADFYGGNQQPIIDQAMSSPFMGQLVQTGEDAIARNAQATGGFRSGTTQENLAQNSQGVLMGLVDQILQGQQGVANAGFGATDAYSTAMQNIISGQGATRGQIANVDINRAGQKGNILGGIGSGLVGGIGSALGGIFSSDEKLKENIIKIGEKNGLNWYSWEWNELAKSIGLSGKDEGHIAQEVQEVRPDLVTTKNGYLAVNYGGF